MQRNKRQKLKIAFIIVIYIVSLLANTIKVFGAELKNGEYLPTEPVTPSAEQYLELRVAEVKEVDGQNKQVIMELWGNNVMFKRI